MTRFIMKKKPQKPERGRVTGYVNVYDDMSLHELIEQVPFDDPSFRSDFYCSYNYGEQDTECYLNWSRDQTNEEFAMSVVLYEKNLAEYNAWHERNKDKIEQYLAEEKAKKEAAEQRRKNFQAKVAAKKEEKERKEYERLKKKYGSIDKNHFISDAGYYSQKRTGW